MRPSLGERFVADHKITVFIWYRIAAGLLLAAAAATGLISRDLTMDCSVGGCWLWVMACLQG